VSFQLLMPPAASYWRIMAAPHWGDFKDEQGTPGSWATVAPQAGQTHWPPAVQKLPPP
jgi:hypothetical protein